jgi:purine-cytosine permease-like protein
MGLVWLTMVTAFPAVLIGFEWFKEGFNFAQVAICTVISCLILLAYSIPASQLGARTGLGYCALSRSVFGQWGTRLVTANLVWVFLAWYGLAALLMARAVNDLFHLNCSVLWMSVGFAFLMAFNNFFGFKGVANFARFFAAPALIAWVGYTFFKAISNTPIAVLTEQPHQPMMHALTAISSFVIGFAIWGNETDYWRFSKAGALRSAVPLAVALLIGQVIFPISGWLVARATGITDSSAATLFLNNYSFAGVAVAGIIILAASYFAANDSNLFALGSAIESIWPLKHRITVTVAATIGALVAAFLSIYESTKAIDVMASLNCIFMPMPTVIQLTEWYLRGRLFPGSYESSTMAEFSEPPAIRWPAAIAWLSGIVVGVSTSGLIPALSSFHVGISAVQAWLTAALVYAGFRLYEYKSEMAAIRTLTEEAFKQQPLVAVAGSDASED